MKRRNGESSAKLRRATKRNKLGDGLNQRSVQFFNSILNFFLLSFVLTTYLLFYY